MSIRPPGNLFRDDRQHSTHSDDCRKQTLRSWSARHQNLYQRLTSCFIIRQSTLAGSFEFTLGKDRQNNTPRIAMRVQRSCEIMSPRSQRCSPRSSNIYIMVRNARRSIMSPRARTRRWSTRNDCIKQYYYFFGSRPCVSEVDMRSRTSDREEMSSRSM